MNLKETYRLIQALSLDITSGAWCCLMAISTVLDIEVKWHEQFLLTSAVWLIYTIDHLLDAHKIDAHAIALRHSIHQQFKIPIITFAILIIICSLYCITLLDDDILKGGLWLCGLVLLYFGIVHFIKGRYFIIKEFAAALVYSTGIVLIPWVRIEEYHFYLLLFHIQIFLLAYCNILILAWFDARKDNYQNQNSVILTKGLKLTVRVTNVLLGIFFVLNVVILFFVKPGLTGFSLFQIVFLLMGLTLSWIFTYPNDFRKNEIYRTIGDLIFLYPFLVIWIK
ncbi:hypothetical protein [Marinigracilibium pacificum]|uniref:UbiA prenyltransferase family protein n=1 Tax=Marinigracilibium pacificum TaxID=2729599 RepID=A0A848ITU4_9BACT|nr:hypothetical protein [Marinigracilibium pacificum]NMM47166.1 hypothetical protein [Marinigracilibium pacificum]